MQPTFIVVVDQPRVAAVGSAATAAPAPAAEDAQLEPFLHRLVRPEVDEEAQRGEPMGEAIREAEDGEWGEAVVVEEAEPEGDGYGGGDDERGDVDGEVARAGEEAEESLNDKLEGRVWGGRGRGRGEKARGGAYSERVNAHVNVCILELECSTKAIS